MKIRCFFVGVVFFANKLLQNLSFYGIIGKN